MSIYYILYEHTHMEHLLSSGGSNILYSILSNSSLYLFSSTVDRVPKKSKFAEWPAEFSVYSRDKYKNFLLTKFLKILQNVRAHQQLM